MLNAWTLWAGALQDVVAMPAVSPYDNPFAAAAPGSSGGCSRGTSTSTRSRRRPGDPMLLIGAVDVLTGDFRAFDSRRDRISVETSARLGGDPDAVPRRAHSTAGRTGTACSRRTRRSASCRRAARRDLGHPDQPDRASRPSRESVLEIADRRNELAGNLSLHQELHFIEKIDQLLEEGALARDGRYRTSSYACIELSRPRLSTAGSGPRRSSTATRAFIPGLMEQGERQAEEFLAGLEFERAWRADDLDLVLRILAPDVELTSSAPFLHRDLLRGAEVHAAVADLRRGARLDLTREQLTHDRATWTVRLDGAVDARGQVEVEFSHRRVVRLRFGPVPA